MANTERPNGAVFMLHNVDAVLGLVCECGVVTAADGPLRERRERVLEPRVVKCCGCGAKWRPVVTVTAERVKE